jgi:hypothetical protein
MTPRTKDKAANPTNALARFSMRDLLLFRQIDSSAFAGSLAWPGEVF